MIRRTFRPILRSLASVGLMACLQGCQHGSTPSVDSLLPPVKPHIDPSVLQDCNTVVDIPHRFVPRHEQEMLHAIDRQSLGDCWSANHAKIKIIRALTK